MCANVCMIAGGKNESWCNHLLLFIKFPFLWIKFNTTLGPLVSSFIENSYLSLMSLQIYVAVLFLKASEAKSENPTSASASAVSMGTQLIKHFENTISFSFCLGKLKMKCPSLEFSCFHWLQSCFLGFIIWCLTFPWSETRRWRTLYFRVLPGLTICLELVLGNQGCFLCIC